MLTSYISSQIYSNFQFEPTFGQKKLIEELSFFIAESKNGENFIVNGYAGTGKTTLIGAVVDTLKKFNVGSVLLAPTGRAAKVMVQYTGAPAYTIHKKIYRQKSITADRFVLDKNLHKDTYFIVDETSMLSNSSYENTIFGSGNLLDDLVEYVNGGTNCRLIFVGDNAQLPPVGLRESPALDEYYMQRYGKTQCRTLSEVLRQEAGSGILMNATKVRGLIERETLCVPQFDMNYPDIKRIGGIDFLEEIDTAYHSYGMKNTLVITRSNKQANRFNQGIRNQVLCQEEEICPGDLVMIVKNNYHYSNGDKDLEFIANGDIAEIVRIRRYEEKYGFRFVDAVIRLPDYDALEMDCKILLDTLSSDTPSLNQEDSRRLFDHVEQEYADIKNKRNRYNKVKEDPYYNALQVKFAFAVTCHKAQGGQWKCVFIDRMLFGSEQITKDLLRWLYTAITRAQEKVYMVNFDDRFFGEPQDD